MRIKPLTSKMETEAKEATQAKDSGFHRSGISRDRMTPREQSAKKRKKKTVGSIITFSSLQWIREIKEKRKVFGKPLKATHE